MKYPTIEEVEKANRYQLCKWIRLLPSPGSDAIFEERFFLVMNREALIMNRIAERWKEAGGFTPEISKAIGWGR